MAASIASVLPLPLVPAICTTGAKRRSGWLSAASSRRTRPSDRSMLLGCSACRRARIRSLAQLAMTRRVRMRLGVGRGWGRDLARRHVEDDTGLDRPIRAQQEIERPGQGGAQLEPMHNLVDHAMRQQILGALEALGQLL